MLVNEGKLRQDYVKLYSLQRRKIGVPIFQRFYDWKEKQTDALLEDLLAIVDKPNAQIYLLDFIYYEEDDKIVLADGQQRVVTVNLLMKAINDYIRENELNIEEIKLFDISYDIEKYNRKYLDNFNNYILAPFKKNYCYFTEWILENKEKLPEIIDAIKNKIFVFIKKAENIDDAFIIFQQINTGGKPLSKEEVIKSTINQFSQIYDIEIKSSLKELKKVILSYYKYMYSSSANDFDTISIMSFLRKDIVSTKEKFKKFADILSIIEKLDGNPVASVISYLNRPQLYDILNIMGLENINVISKRDYFDYVMFPLCLLSISMTLKKSNPGGIIKALYSGVIDQIKNKKSAKDIGTYITQFINKNPEFKISYEDFEEGIGLSDTRLGIKKSILILDVIMRNTSSTLNVDSINLEHIYPKKPEPKWEMEGWPTSGEEQKQVVENIGNYMILNEEVNKKIKNKYIEDKIVEYKRIIPNDNSLQTEMNTVDFEKFKNERVSYIRERQKAIAQMVYGTFKLAKVIITK